METYKIQDDEQFNEVLDYIREDNPQNIKLTANILTADSNEFILDTQYIAQISGVLNPSKYADSLIFGKDLTEEVVSVEIVGDKVRMYLLDGSYTEKDNYYWILSSRRLDGKFRPLKGGLNYKYMRRFKDKKLYKKFCGIYYKQDTYQVWDDVEAAMIYHGITQFKGIKAEDVPILSFDIEGAGLVRNDNSEVFMISNSFRDTSGITKKTFRVDHYKNSREMMEDWCDWVRMMNPTILNGHNVFGYDIDYMDHVIKMQGGELVLGRDDSKVAFGTRPGKYRVDGTQEWEYRKAKIFGRHIIDGMFLAVKHDIGRDYPSWGLKPIAEYEGLVDEDRVFYDASKIGQNWADPIEREKIVAYGEGDSDDSLALYDIMIPSFFYMAQSIPKPFQSMMNGATGSWINSILVRSYLQHGKSIPKANEATTVNGGMSYGIPGVYSNVTKWDAKSYYPSTILEFDIYDKDKDPEANFLTLVKYFTNKRFEQKDEFKRTGDNYWDDLQASSKIFINSSYGVLGTRGLNFNSFENAALITKSCRAGLQKCVYWATGKNIDFWWEEYQNTKTCMDDFTSYFPIDKNVEVKADDIVPHDWQLVNVDTDALAFCKKDQTEFSPEELAMIHKEINEIMYSEWEDDGYYDRILVSKAKNYVTLEKGSDKIKKKGSSLTDTKKEPLLLKLLDSAVKDLIFNDGINLPELYLEAIKEAADIKDISKWVMKKSISKAVLTGERTNESKVRDALGDRPVQEGDKIYIYSDIDGMKQLSAKGELVFLKSGEPKMVENCILRLEEDWTGSYDKAHYVKRVWTTMKTLENVLDMRQFKKFHLKKNMELLDEI